METINDDFLWDKDAELQGIPASVVIKTYELPSFQLAVLYPVFCRV